MIYASTKAITDLVVWLKEQVEQGDIVPGETIININNKQMKGPPSMGQATLVQARSVLQTAGFLVRVGGLLDGKGMLSNTFSGYSVDEIVELTKTAMEEHNKENPRGTRGKLRDEDEEEREQEEEFGAAAGALLQEEDEEVAINVYQIIDSFTAEQSAELVGLLLKRLLSSSDAESQRADIAEYEIQHKERDIAAVREELKTVKAQLMAARDELNRERSHIAPRVVERIVTVNTKPVPKGMEHGATFGKGGDSVVVHRKPLMQHPPKVVQETRIKR